ncbi:MAG TPA: hypothetical protein VGH28_23995 [Polyangiaceae bacterium]|jgi:hypothetical protein
MKTLALASVLALSAVACSVDPSTPTDHMKIYETCKETQCDQMQEDGNSACHACEAACGAAAYDCNSESACQDSCSPRDCSDYDRNTCLDEGYEVTYADNPDPSVDDACNAMLSAISGCGYSAQQTASDCARYASNESADVAVPAYQCVAQLACSAMTDATAMAACNPQPTTFGDEICANLATSCPSETCGSSFQNEIDADAAWLRSDALDAARSCLSAPSCDEARQCLSAWVSAVE